MQRTFLWMLGAGIISPRPLSPRRNAALPALRLFAGLVALLAVTPALASIADPRPITLPIWGDDLVRHPGNPVIVGSDVSPNHAFVADPFLLVVNGKLYLFFEAMNRNGLAEIWMAESPNGFTWAGFRQVSVKPLVFSHPQAFIYDGKVHAFYNYNRDGSIHYRWSPLASFPDWSPETVVFTGSKHDWHHLVEFSILEHRGIWYLLGITGDGRREDQWIRGRWAGRFTTDWDSQSQEMSSQPLLKISDSGWAKAIVELTELRIGDRLFFFMGTTRQADDKRAIGTFAVTELTPRKLEGVWLNDDFTFPLAASGWDDTNMHRATAVAWKDRWIFVYDARRGQEWKIGVATRPLR